MLAKLRVLTFAWILQTLKLLSVGFGNQEGVCESKFVYLLDSSSVYKTSLGFCKTKNPRGKSISFCLLKISKMKIFLNRIRLFRYSILFVLNILLLKLKFEMKPKAGQL